MMSTDNVVYKYSLSVTEPTTWTVHAPEGAKLVLVGHQHSDPTIVSLWLEVNTNNLPVDYNFHISGTGHHLPVGAEHVGSTIAGPYVWHVYKT